MNKYEHLEVVEHLDNLEDAKEHLRMLINQHYPLKELSQSRYASINTKNRNAQLALEAATKVMYFYIARDEQAKAMIHFGKLLQHLGQIRDA